MSIASELNGGSAEVATSPNSLVVCTQLTLTRAKTRLVNFVSNLLLVQQASGGGETKTICKASLEAGQEGFTGLTQGDNCEGTLESWSNVQDPLVA